MAYFDHVTIFLSMNCGIQGEFLLASPIVCNSYVQNILRGAFNAIRGDLQEFADFSKKILGRLPIAFKLFTVAPGCMSCTDLILVLKYDFNVCSKW